MRTGGRTGLLTGNGDTATGDAPSERGLTADVGRTPTLHQKIDSAVRADREVARGAGAGRLR
ncbi:hypothetical protein SMA5143A_1383 [Streptomyces sp. MA5143a]|nr:hypothetical protein SMA5143A_1383 [Streptomyces sp. MA5143a]